MRGALACRVARYSFHVATKASTLRAPGVSAQAAAPGPSSRPASKAASKHVCQDRECQSTWKAHESQQERARGLAKGACT